MRSGRILLIQVLLCSHVLTMEPDIDWSMKIARISESSSDTHIPPDITFKVDEDGVEHKIGAHKIVMGMVSPVFNKLLVKMDALDKRTKELFVKGTTYGSFNIMKNAIYGMVPMKSSLKGKSVSEVFSIYDLVTRYQIPELRKVVQNHLASFPITDDNVLEVAEEAKVHLLTFEDEAQNLLVRCAAYLKPKFKTVQSVLEYFAEHTENKEILHELLVLTKNNQDNNLPIGKAAAIDCRQEPCHNEVGFPPNRGRSDDAQGFRGGRVYGGSRDAGGNNRGRKGSGYDRGRDYDGYGGAEDDSEYESDGYVRVGDNRDYGGDGIYGGVRNDGDYRGGGGYGRGRNFIGDKSEYKVGYGRVFDNRDYGGDGRYGGVKNDGGYREGGGYSRGRDNSEYSGGTGYGASQDERESREGGEYGGGYRGKGEYDIGRDGGGYSGGNGYGINQDEIGSREGSEYGGRYRGKGEYDIGRDSGGNGYGGNQDERGSRAESEYGGRYRGKGEYNLGRDDRGYRKENVQGLGRDDDGYRGKGGYGGKYRGGRVDGHGGDKRAKVVIGYKGGGYGGNTDGGRYNGGYGDTGRRNGGGFEGGRGRDGGEFIRGDYGRNEPGDY